MRRATPPEVRVRAGRGGLRTQFEFPEADRVFESWEDVDGIWGGGLGAGGWSVK
jgi:hypothetical protein